NAKRRIELSDQLYRDAGRKLTHLPDWFLILKRGAHDLKNANPPTDTCQIAKQYIARLDFLYGLPAPLTKSSDVGAGSQELIPCFGCVKIKPVGRCHVEMLQRPPAE